MEPVTAGLITAGASLLGTGATAYAQGKMNKKTRLWNEKMYAQQRRDALFDYHMQNQYNSPQQQMQRLKEAGLNPNLVYGKGADAMGGVVRSTDAKSWNPQSPQFEAPNLPSYLAQFQNMELQKIQTDNVREQIKVAQAQADFIKANTLKVSKDTDRQVFEILKGQTLLDTQLSAAQANVQNIESRTQLNLTQNEINKTMAPLKADQIAQSILNLKSQNATNVLQRSLISQQTEALKIINKYRDVSERQKIDLGNILKESGLLKNILTEKNIQTEGLKQQIMQVEQYAKEKGIDKDYLQTILKVLVPWY